MPTSTSLKPAHKAVKASYAALQTYARQRVKDEGTLHLAVSDRDGVVSLTSDGNTTPREVKMAWG